MTRSGVREQAIRYLVVGGLNTIITYAIFIVLGLILDAGLAFTIAFAVGLVWVVFGSSRLVFRATHSWVRLLLFSAFYFAIYGIGRIIVALMNPHDALALTLTSVVVLIISTPLSFLAGRYIFSPRVAERSDS